MNKATKKTQAQFSKTPIDPQGNQPELFWLEKYGHDDQEKNLEIDICSLYRHEQISPSVLIDKFYHVKKTESPQLSIDDLFGNALDRDKLEKCSEYYQHQDNWVNRLIQGDSLLVMTSLLELEGMAGKVQMIYIDPPYGIQFKGHWHKQMNVGRVEEDNDDHLSGEHEKVRAYRDTWKLGINSYLSHLRDRLIVARELLTSSGSCFVQISDENVHLVRCIMDEVFGRKNFVATIILRTCSNTRHKYLSTLNDYIIWYAKDIKDLKYHQLYTDKAPDPKRFNFVELDNGEIVSVNQQAQIDKSLRPFTCDKLQSSSGAGNTIHPFEYKGKVFKPGPNRGWRCSVKNLNKLAQENRLVIRGSSLRYKYYFDDFPVAEISNLWVVQLSEKNKSYVVQTSVTVLQRCLLMTTDPGDLVLDPTCGGGTAAYMAEQWGRRWITIDTSRIALNLTKKRLMMAVFPYYKLHDKNGPDIRQGFICQKVPHITMKTVIYDEPSPFETLYDKPQKDKKRLRVAGPFTVETLHKPIASEDLDADEQQTFGANDFEQCIFKHLKSAGVKNGMKNQKAVFIRVERLNNDSLHAAGFYSTSEGKKNAYFHIGPLFGTVSKQAFNAAVKECRRRGDANWLIILGFAFENTISNKNVTTRLGHFEVTKVRMHDDLLQQDLVETDKKAASFVTIGEPEIQWHSKTMQVEICGLEIYNPMKDKREARKVHDLAYWMVDDDYDGRNFMVKQVFFCGGDQKAFKKWQQGLSNLVKQTNRQSTRTKIEIDEEAFARVYGHISHPITIKHAEQKIAVRVFSQFGEENTKILKINKNSCKVRL